MIPVFLIGGGWRVETFSQTYGRFLQSAVKNGQRRIAMVVVEELETDSHRQSLRFFDAFQVVGLDSSEAFEIIVSAENPLTWEKLAAAEPTGIFVCGGLTPAYFNALCKDASWLEFLFENEISYAGFSAGASIAAKTAIVGGWRRDLGEQIVGWRRKRGEQFVEIVNENAAEDLDLLDVRCGLALVPFAVEVHATQWGTLSRLIHAVDAGSAEEGWAIDEDTMLEISGGEIKIHGAGNVYNVRRADGKIIVEIISA